MGLKYNRTTVVLDGNTEIFALPPDLDPFLVVVSPLGGATADVEYSASEDFLGAVAEVGVETVPVGTFTFVDATGLITMNGAEEWADFGITSEGDTFQLTSATNSGFYRVLEIVSATVIRVLPLDGSLNDVTEAVTFILSGPTGGQASVWVDWSEGDVLVDTGATLPGSPTAVRCAATGGDVIFEVSGAE